MRWAKGPSPELVSRLADIARARVASSERHAALSADLTHDLRELVRAGATATQLTDLTVRWIRQQDGMATAWFQPKAEMPELGEWSDPGTMWHVPIHDGILAGTSLWRETGFMGTLVTWSQQTREEFAEVQPWVLRAAVWLGSALDLVAQHDPAVARDDEDLLEALRYQLVTTVSHEVRTPLTTIRGGLELLLDGDIGELTPVQRKLLERMSANAARLQVLADDVAQLAYLRNDEQHDVDDVVAAPTAATTTDVAEVARACAERLGAVDRVRIESEDVVLHVDEPTFARALYRLVDNALQASASDQTVTVRAGIEGDLGVVSVIDYGVGIPADELDRVTDAFYRTRRAHAEQLPGAGLGLTLAASLARSRSGTLHLDSEEGMGTTATLSLPLATDAASAKRERDLPTSD